MINAKLLDFTSANLFIDSIREDGKTIVQCHGTFDLLHPGHLAHFEESKVLGDILVVTITSEEYVNKGPSRPFFNNALRVKSLTSIEFIDYVIVVPFPTAVEAIHCVRPDIYCKGKEYENPKNDLTGNILNDHKAVEEIGGKIAYVGSVVFSSTKFLKKHFNAFSSKTINFCEGVSEEFPKSEMHDLIESFKDLKVLVVGDIIFDRYTDVSVQGLTSKSRILSSRFLSEDNHAGGALAAFRHIKEFAPQVKLVSLTGTEDWAIREIYKYIDDFSNEVLQIPEYTTIVKQRFVEPHYTGNQFKRIPIGLKKLFSVNFIDENPPVIDTQKQLLKTIENNIDWADLVLVMDFGHGVMEPIIREFIQENAKFLALNCQTNSNNHGFNLINRKYIRADSFSLDQTEICLATGLRDIDFESELAQLKVLFNASYAWLTRGASDTIGISKDGPPVHCPSFEHNVVDTIGAGDAFCSLASLAAVKGVPINVSTFIGQLAGALAVKIVGNSQSIIKNRFLKSMEAMIIK